MLSEAGLKQPLFVNLCCVVVNRVKFMGGVHCGKFQVCVIVVLDIFEVKIDSFAETVCFFFEEICLSKVVYDFMVAGVELGEVCGEGGVEENSFGIGEAAIAHL
jgi:hypothetical protein